MFQGPAVPYLLCTFAKDLYILLKLTPMILRRMKRRLNDEGWMVPGSTGSSVVNNPLLPHTTGLSPYFSLGCLSTRLFYHIIKDIKAEVKDVATSLWFCLINSTFFQQN